MKKIAIIGLGQLGSRHLQALAALTERVDIELVDLSVAALEVAIARFYEMPAASNFKGTIKKFRSVNDLTATLDLVIIACNSMERRALTELLLNAKTVKYLILEKVLFPSIEDYGVVGELIKQKHVKAWVNCSRRMMPSYRMIKELVTPGAPVHFVVDGAKWGMGSNGIHFIDLFCYLTSDYSLKLHSDLLDEINPVESNRKGYIDFTGTYTGETGRKDFFSMTSWSVGSAPVQVQIYTPFERIVVNESFGNMSYSAEKEGWKTEQRDFEILYQSSLTTILVNDIFKTGECNLPTYNEAKQTHLLFLSSLINYQHKKSGIESKLCQIT